MGAAISAAMSAIDVALWDILGKSVNLPVYQLLGGKCRDRIKVFNNVGGDTLAERAESAIQNVEAGYISLRTTPFFSNWEKGTSTQAITTAVEIVRAIREVVGNDIDLGLEIHRNLTPDEAIILAGELAPFHILYYEDPIAPQSIEALEYVARHVHIPIATGEVSTTFSSSRNSSTRKRSVSSVPMFHWQAVSRTARKSLPSPKPPLWAFSHI